MIRKTVLTIVLAATALLASTAPAHAQRGPGMRHPHPGFGAVRFWAAWNRAVVANYWLNTLVTPGYTYGSSRSLAPLLPRGVDPAAIEERPLDGAAARADVTNARIWIQLPPDAEVTIQGERLNAIGPIRVFNSPPLSTGASEHYDLQATWEEGGKKQTQTQRIDVAAGSRVQVIFGGGDKARVYPLKPAR